MARSEESYLDSLLHSLEAPQTSAKKSASNKSEQMDFNDLPSDLRGTATEEALESQMETGEQEQAMVNDSISQKEEAVSEPDTGDLIHSVFETPDSSEVLGDDTLDIDSISFDDIDIDGLFADNKAEEQSFLEPQPPAGGDFFQEKSEPPKQEQAGENFEDQMLGNLLQEAEETTDLRLGDQDRKNIESMLSTQEEGEDWEEEPQEELLQALQEDWAGDAEENREHKPAFADIADPLLGEKELPMKEALFGKGEAEEELPLDPEELMRVLEGSDTYDAGNADVPDTDRRPEEPWNGEEAEEPEESEREVLGEMPPFEEIPPSIEDEDADADDFSSLAELLGDLEEMSTGANAPLPESDQIPSLDEILAQSKNEELGETTEKIDPIEETEFVEGAEPLETLDVAGDAKLEKEDEAAVTEPDSPSVLDEILGASNAPAMDEETNNEELSESEELADLLSSLENMPMEETEDNESDGQKEQQGAEKEMADADLQSILEELSEDENLPETNGSTTDDKQPEESEELADLLSSLEDDAEDAQTTETDANTKEEELPEESEKLEDLLSSMGDLMEDSDLLLEPETVSDQETENREEKEQVADEKTLTNSPEDDLLSLDSMLDELGEELGDSKTNASFGEEKDTSEDDMMGLIPDALVEGDDSEEMGEETVASGSKKKGMIEKLFANVPEDPEEIAKKKAKEAAKAKAKGLELDENGNPIPKPKKSKEEIKAEKEAKKKEQADIKKQKKQEADKKKAEKAAIKAERKKAKEEKKKKELAEVVEVDEGRINRAGAAIVFAFFGILTAAVIIGSNSFSYRRSVDEAETLFTGGLYDDAYKEIRGLKIKGKDQELYDKIVTVMYVKKQLNSYYNYSNMDMHPEALDSLLKGIQRYDTYAKAAKGLGVKTNLDAIRTQIIKELLVNYQLSEEDAYHIINSRDRETYSQKVFEAATLQ